MMIEEPAVRDFTIQRGSDFEYKFFMRDKYTLEYVSLTGAVITCTIRTRDLREGTVIQEVTTSWALSDVYDYTGALIYAQAPLITISLDETETIISNDYGFYDVFVTIGEQDYFPLKGKITFDGSCTEKP
jgi:hypothetical protein